MLIGRLTFVRHDRQCMSTPAETAFLLDLMLGKLATYLRMCGYDTAYALDRGIEDDSKLRELASGEGRTLLTRDTDLVRQTDGAVLLRGRAIETQLSELMENGFELELDEPARCSACNGPLRGVPPRESTPSFSPSPTEQAVWRCCACGQLFWKGSHWWDVETTLAGLETGPTETYRCA
jgi:uncharacterized protein with PIN domain